MEKAGNFGTKEIRAIIPGEGVTLQTERPSDIYNLRSKAYRWNDIEGDLINCRVSVRYDKKSGTCRVTKRIVRKP